LRSILRLESTRDATGCAAIEFLESDRPNSRAPHDP
jgi:hypothetical protein